jgi:hypothetical protein
MYTLFIQLIPLQTALCGFHSLFQLYAKAQNAHRENNKLNHALLDNKSTLRTLPQSLLGTYYEIREAPLSQSFTPARADARSVHRLPLSEHGDESANTSITNCGVAVTKPDAD